MSHPDSLRMYSKKDVHVVLCACHELYFYQILRETNRTMAWGIWTSLNRRTMLASLFYDRQEKDDLQTLRELAVFAEFRAQDPHVPQYSSYLLPNVHKPRLFWRSPSLPLWLRGVQCAVVEKLSHTSKDCENHLHLFARLQILWLLGGRSNVRRHNLQMRNIPWEENLWFPFQQDFC